MGTKDRTKGIKWKDDFGLSTDRVCTGRPKWDPREKIISLIALRSVQLFYREKSIGAVLFSLISKFHKKMKGKNSRLNLSYI
jgi:hypothetical protein